MATLPNKGPSASANNKKVKANGQANKPLPSGVAYMNATGLLERILKKIIEAPEPEKLTHDYLGNVWSFSGGSARAAIPFLKKAGLLSSDGSPTDVYSQFRSESERGAAASKALRQAFADLYRVSDFLERAPDPKVVDVIVQVTGRGKDDPIVRAISGSFKALSQHAATSSIPLSMATVDESAHQSESREEPTQAGGGSHIGLSYQINLILPESKDVEIYDAIFKSLKRNLL